MPYRIEQQAMFPEVMSCPCCNSLLSPIGPLWLGSIRHKETLMQMKEKLHSDGSRYEKRPVKTRSISVSKNCRHQAIMTTISLRKLPAARHPRIDTVIACILASGYPATRTHFSGYGIKTDAPPVSYSECHQCSTIIVSRSPSMSLWGNPTL